MIERNRDLKEMNTFMVPVKAHYFGLAESVEHVVEILKSDEWKTAEKKVVLGGGSNMLFVTDNIDFVLKNEIGGVGVAYQDTETITIRVGAGEPWASFVLWAADKGYWGIENLAHIPGTVGAAPVQNIGAYGVEVESVISKVDCVHRETLEQKTFSHEECDFSYRNSIFKKERDTYIITNVYFVLQKNGTPNLTYKPVAEAFSESDISKLTPREIADAIIAIRQSKLPEVGEIGMAGSFFKNPIIEQDHFHKLQVVFPDVKYFEMENGDIKVSAGWLLDELGYKGLAEGNVGNYEKHALIVTHNGKGTGLEVYEHIQNIMKKVKDVYNLDLELEVNIIT